MRTVKARGVLQQLQCSLHPGFPALLCAPRQPRHCLQAPSPKIQIWPCSSPTPIAALCSDQDQAPYPAIPGPLWPCLHLFLALCVEAMPNFWWPAPCFSFTPVPLLLLWLLVLSSLPLFAWRDPAHLLSISSVIFFRRHSGDPPPMSSVSLVCVLSHWYPGPTPTMAFGATWYYLCTCHPQPTRLLLEESRCYSLLYNQYLAKCLAQSQHWINSCWIEFHFFYLTT